MYEFLPARNVGIDLLKQPTSRKRNIVQDSVTLGVMCYDKLLAHDVQNIAKYTYINGNAMFNDIAKRCVTIGSKSTQNNLGLTSTPRHP